jgi:ATP-dependent RNA helicase DDX46/PRP5
MVTQTELPTPEPRTDKWFFLVLIRAGAQPPEGERKLYLLIEAPTEAMVKRAKQEIRRVIEELVEKAMRRDVGAGARGRYNIM